MILEGTQINAFMNGDTPADKQLSVLVTPKDNHVFDCGMSIAAITGAALDNIPFIDAAFCFVTDVTQGELALIAASGWAESAHANRVLR